MAFNLKNRSFLKEIDFTPREFRYLLDLSAATETRQIRRHRDRASDGQEHRADLREDLDPHPLRLRGRRLRSGRARHLSRSVRLADRA